MKNQSRRKYVAMTVIVGLLSTGTLFQNCSQQKFTKTANPEKTLNTLPGESSASSTLSAGDNVVPVVTPPQVIICDAFGSGQSSVATAGLKAELRYLNPTLLLPVEESAAILSIDYFKDADTRFIKVPETIYFSDVNVPARSFDQGFLNSKGVLLRDNQGNVLQEYFALKIETELRLAANEQNGYYEFATISDDGTVVEMMISGIWTRIISNDGAHNPKMGCTTNKIYLSQQSRIPIRIYYNQGPKVTIANVLYKNYRGAHFNEDLLLPRDQEVHAVCGVSAESDFWNLVTSQPGPLITKITAAGWKPLTAENFQLTNNQINPCAAH